MNEQKLNENSTAANSKSLNNLEFDLSMAEVIWQKVKGISIPESYSQADRLHILERYWHRAM